MLRLGGGGELELGGDVGAGTASVEGLMYCWVSSTEVGFSPRAIRPRLSKAVWAISLPQKLEPSELRRAVSFGVAGGAVCSLLTPPEGETSVPGVVPRIELT